MYAKLKNNILGKKYSLSIAFISANKSREINKKYRKKDKPANVLAFPYSQNEGEILLAPQVIKREAKDFGLSAGAFERFLVIHGMLHLKGMRHGGIMEKAEKKYYEKYLDLYRQKTAYEV